MDLSPLELCANLPALHLGIVDAGRVKPWDSRANSIGIGVIIGAAVAMVAEIVATYLFIIVIKFVILPFVIYKLSQSLGCSSQTH